MEVIKVKSTDREQFVDITARIQRRVSASGLREGVCVLFVQHTTAGLTINENSDPDVTQDLLLALRSMVPRDGLGFQHGEQNSDAHVKSSVIGSSVTVPFHDGKLLLGRWQGVFLGEFDGPKERRVILTYR